MLTVFEDVIRQLENAEKPANTPPQLRGETALWRAVIVQALTDAVSQSHKRPAAFFAHTAREWLTGNSRDFAIVCDHAGMDPGYVRRMAKRALLAGCKWRNAPGKGRRSHRTKPPPAPTGDDDPCPPAAILTFSFRRYA